MGDWFVRYFSENGFGIGLYSRKLKKQKKNKSKHKIFDSIQDCVVNSDIVIVSVPIESTNQIVDQVIKYSDKNNTVIEISSVKKQIVSNMKKLSKTSNSKFLSIHPLFGPGANIFKPQKYILVPIKSSSAEKRAFRELFPNSKLLICNVREHD